MKRVLLVALMLLGTTVPQLNAQESLVEKLAQALQPSTEKRNVFRGKVVRADNPEKIVPQAKIFWYAIGKNSWGEGQATSVSNGKFRITHETSDLLVLVFDPESSLCGSAVLTPGKQDTIIPLSEGDKTTLQFKLQPQAEGEEAKPIPNLRVSCALIITDKGGQSRLHLIPHKNLDKIPTDSEGNVTISSLPKAPEGMSQFGYYLVLNQTVSINGDTKESLKYYRPIDLGSPQNATAQFNLSPGDLRVEPYVLMDFLFSTGQSFGDFTQSAPNFLADAAGKKQQILLLLFKPADAIEFYESEQQAGKILSSLLYDPQLRPLVEKYNLQGLRMSIVQHVQSDKPDEMEAKLQENEAAVRFVREIKPGLEKVDLLTLCVLDSQGKLIVSQPIKNLTGKKINSAGKESDELIPELLIPFLEAFSGG